MDLEDLFKGHKQKQHHHEYNHHSQGSYGHDTGRHLSKMQHLLGNKRLLLVIGVVLVVLLLLAIGAIIFLLPMLGKLLGLVDAKGIQGLLDSVLQIAKKIWGGAGA